MPQGLAVADTVRGGEVRLLNFLKKGAKKPERVLRMCDAAEMRGHLEEALSQEPYLREQLLDLLIARSAGKEFSATGVALMVTMAVKDCPRAPQMMVELHIRGILQAICPDQEMVTEAEAALRKTGWLSLPESMLAH